LVSITGHPAQSHSMLLFGSYFLHVTFVAFGYFVENAVRVGSGTLIDVVVPVLTGSFTSVRVETVLVSESVLSFVEFSPQDVVIAAHTATASHLLNLIVN
jgi:hypothetical protein